MARVARVSKHGDRLQFKKMLRDALSKNIGNASEQSEREEVAQRFEHMAEAIRADQVNGPVEMKWTPGKAVDSSFHAKNPIEFVSATIDVDAGFDP